MRVVFLFVFTILHSNLYLMASTYYVAPVGNDISSGSEDNPWRTIQKAANSLVAGDTVFIKAGIYNERVIVQNSGTTNNYIVFTNYQNDIVTIDGTDINWWEWNGLFDIVDKSYIEINGLNITNSSYGGIWIEDSHHININYNYTYNTFSCGIGVWASSNIFVGNNEVELACNDGDQECISIANSNYCRIESNHIHHNGPGTAGGEGIDVKAGSHDIVVFGNVVHHLNNRIGIYTDAWDAHTYNIDVINNRVSFCKNSGIAIASERGGKIEDVRFINNISYYNKWGGIELGGWTDSLYNGPTPVINIKFINNTCYKNGAIDDGWGFGIVINNEYAENVIVRNNICSDNNAQIGIENILSGGVIDHNLINGINNVAGALYGSDSVISNPLFVDSSNFNFHLLGSSLAINNGSALGATDYDYDNNLRPVGDGYDIGAYEYNTVSNINSFNSSGVIIEIYPNPVSTKLSVLINEVDSGDYIFLITDIFGNLVIKETKNHISNSKISFDTNQLNSGLYILQIVKNSQILASKNIIVN